MKHLALALTLASIVGCETESDDLRMREASLGRPESGWSMPEVLVQGAPLHGVHGLAVDARGRLLAGSVVGHNIWEIDRQTGSARVFIAAPEGEADDLAVGPRGELAWTSYTQGILRYRASDTAPILELARDLPGINSLAFDVRRGKLYASQVFLADAIWEIDLAQKAPPRRIAKDLGGFNGFEVGPDGMLYGPLWFKGQVVRIDPANGAVEVIQAGFQVPAAANLDGRGNLWVIDTKTGELVKIELATGTKSVVTVLATALDNLAIAPDGTVYVSNMADNSVQAVDPGDGSVRTLTRGALAVPTGMKLVEDTLYIADVFAFRAVNVRDGKVRDVHRMQASDLEYPSAVGFGGGRFALSSWFSGSVQLLEGETQRHLETIHGFVAPMDALPLADGSLLVAELGTGQLVHVGVDRTQRKVVTSSLLGPTQLLRTCDGAVYVTEAGGTLSRIELATGARVAVAEGLAMPEGLAETPWNTLVVAETAARRLTEIDPRTGSRRVVAEQLPIGLVPGRPGLPPPYHPTGVAVGSDGSVYVAADLDNSVLRIRPRR